ncbi:hypothetical protein J4Q44_G00084580 [Coregonus suidteri]|uniref:BHLH domain-containing protein n=1 Tax=Coregonus suidteri TaxID=861788 RepID=A0AAN8M6C6_9TELE
MEEADILEMTVCFLRRQKQQQQTQPVSSSSCSAHVNQGYSRCVQEILHFLSKDERPLQHRDQAMAPTITSAMIYSKEHLTLTNKLRKPVVEKIFRGRINSSLEQLKSLLGPEILNHQPDSEMEKADILQMTEKADILEMTVCLLRRQQQSQPRRLLSHFQSLQPSSDKNRREIDLPQLSPPPQHSISKEKSPVNSALWRPW